MVGNTGIIKVLVYLPFFFLLPFMATILTPIPMGENGGFPLQQEILQHQLVSYSSTQFWPNLEMVSDPTR